MTDRTVADPYLPETRWRLIDVVLVVLAGIAASWVLGGAVLAVRGVTEVGAAEQVIVFLAQQIGSITALAVFSQSRGSGNWRRDFGLTVRVADLPGLLAGAALQLAAALVVFAVSEGFGIESPPRQNVVEVVSAADDTGLIVVLVALIVVVAPVIEEITFRGMLLSRLRRSLGPWPSILISAAVFAGLHFALDPDSYLAATGLFVVGIALAWAALRRGDLGVSILLHVGVNLLAVVVLLGAPSDLAAMGTWYLVLST